MKTGILYYSLTGRNQRVSEIVSKQLGYQSIKIEELKKRKITTVAWDLALGRTPKVVPDVSVIDDWDMVILFTPVWMGVAATPVRAYLRHIKKTKKDFMFLSVCGGAEESNPNLAQCIQKRAGHQPKLLLEMHVADLMHEGVTREETQAYKISDEEYQAFADRAVKAIKIGNREKVIGNREEGRVKDSKEYGTRGKE